MRSTLHRLAASAAIWAAAMAAPAHAEGADPARVVATVNGTEITLGHVALMAAQLPPETLAEPPDVLFSAILDQLIRQAALASLAGEQGLRERLAIENYTRIVGAAKVLEGAVAEGLTEDALKAAYGERFSDRAPETEYNAAHILVTERAEADRIAAEIAAGGDFAELARRHSIDGAAVRGGDLGWFGPGVMVPAFEAAVMALQPGQVSEPVQTQFGWHLVKLLDSRIASVPSFETVREGLAAEVEDRIVGERIAEAVRAATVERMVDGLDPAAAFDPALFGN
ncbi:MAG: peptidylprolyl isomerase [Gemmobacter sp.]